jgi:F0F1-type ATP synthase assembly protein I
LQTTGQRPEGTGPRRFLRGFRKGVEHEAQAGTYIGLGLTFALAILLFFGLGYKLDAILGTLPLFSLIGALLGGVGGFIYLYRAVIRNSNSNSDRKPPNT